MRNTYGQIYYVDHNMRTTHCDTGLSHLLTLLLLRLTTPPLQGLTRATEGILMPKNDGFT